MLTPHQQLFLDYQQWEQNHFCQPLHQMQQWRNVQQEEYALIVKKNMQLMQKHQKEQKKILLEISPASGFKVDVNNMHFYKGKGCDKCHGIGYKGRIGLYEIMEMCQEIEQVILSGKVSEYEIEEIAIKNGMLKIVQDGLLKALEGTTTIEEVFRVSDQIKNRLNPVFKIVKEPLDFQFKIMQDKQRYYIFQSKNMPKQKLLILDGNALVHRAFHALPSTMSTKSGIPTNAIYGFLAIFIKALKDIKPTHIAISFDVSKHTFRNDLYPEYKANRVKQPDELYTQFPYIKEIIKYFNICLLYTSPSPRDQA
eukprot:TRINITY_DN11501_c0_g1_i1.p1 TRINITY_DN11501_c0_g1~~TRINITY_DN11501_c0_g1_i1.p1  ORF type:complete len:310 (-),score=25.87 TRINITY_DN11501_c0_g1_i1:90-1019(-)